MAIIISGDPTINGTGGNDQITGTNGLGVSVIAGFGNDTVNTVGGNDFVDGGEGNDTISTGAGHDFVTDEAGNDRIITGTGNDTVIDFGGNDFIDTGGGDDVVVAVNSGSDTVFAGSGNDTVTINAGGNDTAFGGSGNDVISTFAGTDSVDAGSGDDTVAGGSGADWLSGGTGFDTLNYQGSGGGVTVNLTTNDAFGGDAEGDTIAGFEHVLGSIGNDVLIGNALGNSLFGFNGNDTLSGEGGNDFLSGGNDLDTISDGTGADVVSGDADNDTINLANDGTTDLIDLNPGGGIDTINGFNAGAPAAGGDRLDINDLINFVGPGDLSDAIAGGFVQTVEIGGGVVAIEVDPDGALNGGSFTQVARLPGLGAPSGVAVNNPLDIALLDDNIVVA